MRYTNRKHEINSSYNVYELRYKKKIVKHYEGRKNNVQGPHVALTALHMHRPSIANNTFYHVFSTHNDVFSKFIN